MRKFFFIVALFANTAIFSYCRFPAYEATYSLLLNNIAVGKVIDVVSRKSGNRFSYNQFGSASYLVLSDKYTSKLTGLITKNGFRPLHLDFKRKWKNEKVNRSYKLGQYGPQSYLLQMRYGLLKGKINHYLKIFVSSKHIVNFTFKQYGQHSYDSGSLGPLMLTPVSYVATDGTNGVDWYSRKYGFLLIYSEKQKKGSRLKIGLNILSYKPNYSQCLVK
jgi:hypothetical protein